MIGVSKFFDNRKVFEHMARKLHQSSFHMSSSALSILDALHKLDLTRLLLFVRFEQHIIAY